jgi:ligand-binding sensor domain-containing protein
MWFGTEGGVSQFDGKVWKSFTKKDGLVDNLVRTIVEDREGNMWFDTHPYAQGKGGISIAKRVRTTESITEQVVRYLPDSLTERRLGPRDYSKKGGSNGYRYISH